MKKVAATLSSGFVAREGSNRSKASGLHFIFGNLMSDSIRQPPCRAKLLRPYVDEVILNK